MCYHSPSIKIIDDDKLILLIKKASEENVLIMVNFNFGSSMDWKNNISTAQGELLLESITKNLLLLI